MESEVKKDQGTKKVYEKFFAAQAAAEYVKGNKNDPRIEENHREMASTILKGIYHGDTLVEYLNSPEVIESTPQAIAKAINFFSEQTEYALQKEKIGNLYSFFEKSIDKNVSPEIRKKIKFLYHALKDKPLGEVLKEFGEAMKTIEESKNKEGQEKSEKYKKAKMVIEKYYPFRMAYQSMHSTKLEWERYKVISGVNNKSLENIVKSIRIPEPKKE